MTNRDPYLRLDVVRPNGRTETVFIDEWAWEPMVMSGLRIGFVGSYQEEPYPWLVTDTPDRKPVERLHVWLWRYACGATVHALAETLLVLMRLHSDFSRSVARSLAYALCYSSFPRLVIHHGNERKTDARLRNLHAMDRASHAKHHQSERNERRQRLKLDRKLSTKPSWWRPQAPKTL